MEEEQKHEEESSKKSYGWLIMVVLLIVVGGVVAVFSSQKPVTKVAQKVTVTKAPTKVPEKVFTVKGTNYTFDPNTITVNKGDNVKIIFQDDDGLHDLVIDGYGVKTQKVRTGDNSSVEFTADKTGSFEYYCSVGKHRELGMKGTLVVQ